MKNITNRNVIDRKLRGKTIISVKFITVLCFIKQRFVQLAFETVNLFPNLIQVSIIGNEIYSVMCYVKQKSKSK